MNPHFTGVLSGNTGDMEEALVTNSQISTLSDNDDT